MSEGNYFIKLFGINVSDKIEKKNGLSYVSWCYAWSEVKKLFPDATYTVYENAQGWNYHTDGRTCWVKTGVTVNGIEHIEMLPVMDFKNRSIPVEQVTSFDVNKAIQRSLTKACARHGLGLYVYAGEDLPEEEAKKQTPPEDAVPETVAPANPFDPIEAIKKFCAKNNIGSQTFAQYRGGLIAANMVKAIEYKDMTADDTNELFKAIKREYLSGESK